MTAVKIENQNPQVICHKKKIYIWRLQKLFRSNSNWEYNKTIQKKNEIDKNSLIRSHKEFIKNYQY